MTNSNMNRRSFLKNSTLGGSAFILSINLLQSCKPSVVDTIPTETYGINAFLKIRSDGNVVIYAPNPEIGQGVRTAMPMIVAEELEIPWDRVKVKQAPLDTDLYKRQVAGGSGSIRSSYEILRKAGATAREMLKTAAAKQWNVETSKCQAKEGYIHHANNKLSYGELAQFASEVDVPEEVSLIDPQNFKLIGTRVPNSDNPKIVTGQPLFGIDTYKKGMLTAVVQRPPAFGMKIANYDDAKTKSIPGVQQVVQFKNKIAVLANTTWEAIKGREVLEVDWTTDSPLESTADHQHQLNQLLKNPVADPKRKDGNVNSAFKRPFSVIESTYEAPFLPHATMEPMNFYADVQGEYVELIGPTQTPARARQIVSKMLEIPEENITVQMTRMGGGFGRRLRTDFVEEAAMISKLSGSPVQVIWTREDDMQGGFYRPAGIYNYRAAIDDNKNLVAWHLRAAAVNTGNGTRQNNFPAGAVPNFQVDFTKLESNVTIGAWRAPNHNFIAYTEESFIDEIAHSIDKDPIAFRLELLENAANNPTGDVSYDCERYAHVIRHVADMANWGKPAENNRYQGFGAHFSFGTYVAEIAEISLVNDTVKVEKIFAAVDCGQVINQSGAETQIEGGIIDGIGHAMFGNLTIKDGKVQQLNFDKHRLIRISESPELLVEFIKNDHPPTGLGEPGLPPAAAAVANAIFAATGQRLRKQPFNQSSLLG